MHSLLTYLFHYTVARLLWHVLTLRALIVLAVVLAVYLLLVRFVFRRARYDRRPYIQDTMRFL